MPSRLFADGLRVNFSALLRRLSQSRGVRGLGGGRGRETLFAARLEFSRSADEIAIDERDRTVRAVRWLSTGIAYGGQDRSVSDLAQSFDVWKNVAPHVPIQSSANDPHASTGQGSADFDDPVVEEVDFVYGHDLGIADAVEDRSGIWDGLGGGGPAVVCDDVRRRVAIIDRGF